MATNKIGKGTVNVGINLVKGEKDILARLAMAEDRSLGDFIRRLALGGLRNYSPAAASEMEECRRLHREQLLLNI